MGAVYASELYPEQCQELSTQGSPYVPAEGAYYFGAVADPSGHLDELSEDNNITTGGRIGIGDKPDLVVTSVRGAAGAQLGQQLTVTVTVSEAFSSPSAAVRRRTNTPGPGNVAVVSTAEALPKVTVPGPLSVLHKVLGGCPRGSPSSAMVPLRLAVWG